MAKNFGMLKSSWRSCVESPTNDGGAGSGFPLRPGRFVKACF